MSLDAQEILEEPAHMIRLPNVATRAAMPKVFA